MTYGLKKNWIFGFHIVILQCNYMLTMGVTKTDLFSDVQNDLATAAKAFAHPARIAIIQHLLKANACINGDLVLELGLAQPTISQHLRELKDIGIIQGTIEGSRVSYCINPQRWEEIKTQFNALFNEFESPGSGDCC
jgi:predicted transcriptional regulator